MGDSHVCLQSFDSSLVYIWVRSATRLSNVPHSRKLPPQTPKPSRNPDPKVIALPIPGGFILEGSVVQPQLQVMRLLPHCNVELLCAAHDVLVMTLSRRIFLFIIKCSCMLCLHMHHLTAHQQQTFRWEQVIVQTTDLHTGQTMTVLISCKEC